MQPRQKRISPVWRSCMTVS
jgi:Multidrug resistance efflux pump